MRAGSTTTTWSNSRPLARVTGTTVTTSLVAAPASTSCGTCAAASIATTAGTSSSAAITATEPARVRTRILAYRAGRAKAGCDVREQTTGEVEDLPRYPVAGVEHAQVSLGLAEVA